MAIRESFIHEHRIFCKGFSLESFPLYGKMLTIIGKLHVPGVMTKSAECNNLSLFCLSSFSIPLPFISSSQVEQFFDKGFVLVPSFFTMEEMQPAVEAVEECVDILANRLYLAGKGKERGMDGGREEGDGWMDR